jgi:SAM-dependent methyltransferase
MRQAGAVEEPAVTRSRFAGGDPTYLRDEQYADSSRLTDRATLHDRYGTAIVPWFDWVRTRLDVQAGDCVLDVGCGAGWLWGQCSTPLPSDVSLTLVDLSPGMVGEAVDRATASDAFASVVGRPAEAQALPFADASFDRVVANHMLYHLPDPELGVAELARVVRPGGLVVAATNGSRHLAQLHDVEAEVLGVPWEDDTLAVFGADVGFGILRRRFGEVHWSQYDDELRCTEVDDVLTYICSSPPGEDATGDQRRALRQAIEHRMVDGALTVTKDVGLFACRDPIGARPTAARGS